MQVAKRSQVAKRILFLYLVSSQCIQKCTIDIERLIPDIFNEVVNGLNNF